jgi:hypothetical protein
MAAIPSISAITLDPLSARMLSSALGSGCSALAAYRGMAGGRQSWQPWFGGWTTR